MKLLWSDNQGNLPDRTLRSCNIQLNQGLYTLIYSLFFALYSRVLLLCGSINKVYNKFCLEKNTQWSPIPKWIEANRCSNNATLIMEGSIRVAARRLVSFVNACTITNTCRLREFDPPAERLFAASIVLRRGDCVLSQRGFEHIFLKSSITGSKPEQKLRHWRCLSHIWHHPEARRADCAVHRNVLQVENIFK